MLYYKIPFKTGGAFTYPDGCILVCAFYATEYMYCKFEKVTSVGSGWVAITESEFEVRCPDFPAPDFPPVQEVIATSATIASGSLVLALPASVDTGTLVKFTAPCACSSVTTGIAIDGETYSVADAMCQIVNGKDGVWTSGAQVAVIIDKANKLAYVQNAGKANPSYDDVGAAPDGHKHSAKDINSGTLNSDRLPVVPISKGGHGADNGSDGLKNLLADGPMVLSEFQVCDTLPDPGIKNRLFIKEVKQEASAGPGYFDLTESSFGITLRVHYSVNHNEEADTFDVAITNLQVMSSASSEFLSYLDGEIMIAGSSAVSMSSDSGAHSVYVSDKNVFYDVKGTLGAVSGISSNGDGAKTVTISVNVSGNPSSGNKWTVSGSKDVALSADGGYSLSYSLYIDTGTALVKIAT